MTLRDKLTPEDIVHRLGLMRYSRHFKIHKDAISEINVLRNSVQELLEALEEISKGEGAFSTDSMQHAANCIENMQRIAFVAIKKTRAKALPSTERTPQ